MGVNLPCAAAVAAAVAGNASDRHFPNGAIVYMEMWSEILAAGLPHKKTVRSAWTVNRASLSPQVHRNVAPEHT